MEQNCFTIVYEENHEPAVGKFRNVILEDPANNIVYMYDSCGAYTTATSTYIEGNAQTLHWDPVTRMLSISDGNSVNIPSDNTDNQTLSYNADTNELSIERGNTVTLQTIDPDLLPYGGTYVVSGGLFTPGVGLQGNISNVDFFYRGKRYQLTGLPIMVFQPTVDTYVYIDGPTQSIQTQVVGHNDGPPVFTDDQILLRWVRSQAASITNHEDIRLMRMRGYAMRMVPSSFVVPNDSFTRVPFNTVGSIGYRFGSPFRNPSGSTPGVHRIPKTGIWNIGAILHLGSWAGTYRCMLAVYVNGQSVQAFEQMSPGGPRNGGSADASSGIQRMAGYTERYLQEGDLVEVRIWHSVGSNRTMGTDGYLTLSLKGS